MIQVETMKLDGKSADLQRDISAIVALEGMLFSDAWSRVAIEGTLDEEQAFVVVAKYRKELIGYCIVYHVMGQGEVVRMAVHPKHQKVGVGYTLFSQVQQHCCTRDIDQLFLEVRESNHAAISLYKKFGFVVDGMRKDFYTYPLEHALLMSGRCVRDHSFPYSTDVHTSKSGSSFH